ncbi:hypothetical protein HMPREF2526_01160 [Corynebacterium sp. HMSC070E08]|uniref:hypothetical protein n=1 Tax=Corynebacterium sp. HMSC070E08 TaxID=1715006 RepID=UPI0008A3F383|nr:hypothetical protein [Corynebacterium sp. HMSC070E08]OFN79742.1 hypothetical protein HMPREF2526_01160 [Corynebacterium sp. HMSC070E08]
MKRISRNLTAAALASSLALAGATAANAEENTELNGDNLVDAVLTTNENNDTVNGEAEGDNAGKTEGEAGDNAGKTEGEKQPGNDKQPGKGDTNKEPGKGDTNKEKSSFDDIKAKLSSEEGKPTDLGIAAIVLGVLGAIAAAVPAAAQALNIKLPF